MGDLPRYRERNCVFPRHLTGQHPNGTTHKPRHLTGQHPNGTTHKPRHLTGQHATESWTVDFHGARQGHAEIGTG